MIDGGIPLSQMYERTVSDEELIETVLSKRPSEDARLAASTLLGRYRQQVYQWCFRYAREHEAALDMAQDVLLRAYEKLDTFQGRSRFSSWLFAVTRSVCLNAIQRVELRYDGEVDDVADRAPRPDEAFEALSDRDYMMRTIQNTLDAEEQEAVVLRYFEHMTPDEITRIMGLDSRSGARGLLQRARRKLVNAVREQRGEV